MIVVFFSTKIEKNDVKREYSMAFFCMGVFEGVALRVIVDAAGHHESCSQFYFSLVRAKRNKRTGWLPGGAPSRKK